MSSHRQGFLALLAAAGLAAGGIVLAQAPAQAATCVLRLRSGSQACYGPAQIAQAERRAPFTTIRPTAAVASASRLRLAQVSAITGQTGRVAQLAYYYGVLRHGLDLNALPRRSAPPYILIQEIRGAVVPGHARIAGAHGGAPWTFTAARVLLKGGHLSLIVTSNLSRTVVQTIGEHLLKTVTRSK